MVIFVKAWCWIYATFLSRRTLCATYFPNLRWKLFPYFFPKEIYWNCYRKILCENWKPNRTLSINFVLKIRFRKIRCEIKTWNQTLYTIYFPNLRWTLLSYFFWIIITENLTWKFKTEPNFVDKLCVEITFSGKFAVKLKPETKRCVKIYFAWQSELCR